MEVLARAGDGGRLAERAASIDAACRDVLAHADRVAAEMGVDPLTLRGRAGALMASASLASSVPDGDDLFVTAVVAATGPCSIDRAMGLLGVALAVDRDGPQGDGCLRRLAKAEGNGTLVSWHAPLWTDRTGGRNLVVEARPGIDLPDLGPDLLGLLRRLAALPRQEFDPIVEKAAQDRAYAASLVEDPVPAHSR